MTISDEEYIRLVRAIQNAKDWADQGHPEAVWSYLDEADSILDNKKSSVRPELTRHTDNYSIHDQSW